MERALMCIVGDHPHSLPGGGTTHDRFAEIAEATQTVDVTLFIIPDLRKVMRDTQFGHPNLGTAHRTIHSMRLLASRLAKDGGYDWLFIVENDIELPMVDTLDRLVAHRKDIMVPRNAFPGEAFEFSLAKVMGYQPQEEEGQTGLHRIRYGAFPATLYRMEAFKDLDPMFVGGGEGGEYERWQNHGIEGWMDLDVEGNILRLGSYQTTMWGIPLKYRMHRKLLPDGSVERCAGRGYHMKAQKIEGPFAARCGYCGYYIEYRPSTQYKESAYYIEYQSPAGYRGKTLQELGLLESGAGKAG